jgi:hypothetical protein
VPCCHACAGESGDVHAETLALLADFGVATEPFTDEVLACLPPTVWQSAAWTIPLGRIIHMHGWLPPRASLGRYLRRSTPGGSTCGKSVSSR